MKRLAFLVATAGLVMAPVANAEAIRSGGALPSAGKLSSADVQRVSGPVSNANQAIGSYLPFIIVAVGAAVILAVSIGNSDNSTDSP